MPTLFCCRLRLRLAPAAPPPHLFSCPSQYVCFPYLALSLSSLSGMPVYVSWWERVYEAKIKDDSTDCAGLLLFILFKPGIYSHLPNDQYDGITLAFFLSHRYRGPTARMYYAIHPPSF